MNKQELYFPVFLLNLHGKYFNKKYIFLFFVCIKNHITGGIFGENIKWHMDFYTHIFEILPWYTTLSISTAIYCDFPPLNTLIIRVIYRSNWLICYYLPITKEKKLFLGAYIFSELTNCMQIDKHGKSCLFYSFCKRLNNLQETVTIDVFERYLTLHKYKHKTKPTNIWAWDRHYDTEWLSEVVKIISLSKSWNTRNKFQWFSYKGAISIHFKSLMTT